MRPIRVAWVTVGIIEGRRLERDGIGGFEIGKTGVAVGWIFEKSCGIPVDVLWEMLYPICVIDLALNG